ncbi:formate dehydrogenase accessory sulfurtransferase FdhD [Undibacterium cyanobacteriorum]|uniref:Sulfur carrier protein FdhD n=1 Tax=Undibacterium cyanobacteriorum TaxID=3073561 RepID=A0ABY9RM33_9BURK|nr:formate dehydrogenase accessory sulfurtransferase FdhD [Undibacterium sp. 20NA77.5]WMW81325.1 formate dehydrogenase accessory sulfurtransferase FdhD [Undibacterium sp. 20NA77.5]
MKRIDERSLESIESLGNEQGQAPAHAQFPAIQLSQGVRTDSHDHIAIEAPVAIVINGISYAVMMASPEALEDFAYGFALSEGIVDHAAQIYDCDVVPHAQGYNVELRIANECFFQIKERQRQLSGRTGCGLCGISSIEELLRDLAPLDTPSSTSDIQVSLSAITLASQHLRAQQALMEATGATHAAAWCNLDGEIVVLREDVGRHNALDKVIGALARNKMDGRAGFALITSRASYELIEKCVRARIAVLAAVSGVTSLAIDVAERSQLCLLGYTRDNKTTIYTHAQRIQVYAKNEIDKK